MDRGVFCLSVEREGRAFGPVWNMLSNAPTFAYLQSSLRCCKFRIFLFSSALFPLLVPLAPRAVSLSLSLSPSLLEDHLYLFSHFCLSLWCWDETQDLTHAKQVLGHWVVLLSKTITLPLGCSKLHLEPAVWVFSCVVVLRIAEM